MGTGVASHLMAGEKIPQYMINALEAHASGNLSGDLRVLLQQLTQ